MALAGAAAEERSLGTRPSHDLVKQSRKAVSRIETEFAWKIQAIAALPNPPDMDISLCEAAKAAMEAEAKRIAEEEKAPHRSVIQLEELFQMYDSMVKKSENPAISKTEADIQGNMKLDLPQLLHELSRLLLLNLPDSAHKLSTIAKLDLSNNNMKRLPESVTSLVNLRALDAHSNQLTSLPHSMGRLQKLKILNISGNFFAELPESIQNCRLLEELIADFNKLQRLPETLGIKLFNLQKLSVHSNKLFYLPSSISCLMSLRVLDVHMNKLRYLPEDIDNLVSLQILNVSFNFGYLNALPDSICGLCSLVELDASYNQIKALPDFFGGLVKLKRLNLEGNPLIRPPPEIVRDGLEAINKYLSNRPTKSLMPRSLSSLVGKLTRRCILHR
jgi:Leucine-rich repeat (LRR) protein